MGKHHGSLAQAGKVRNNTPKVATNEMNEKVLVGCVHLRKLYNKRVLGINPGSFPLFDEVLIGEWQLEKEQEIEYEVQSPDVLLPW
jgi:small subunit ribosomal protein S30e